MDKKGQKSKKPRIVLKPKKARKIFATAVSRGVNEERKKSETAESDEQDAKVANDKRRHFSASANFALMKQLDGTLDFEEGTTSLWAMRIYKGYGAILEKDYDFSFEGKSKEENMEFYKKPIPKSALRNAYNFREGWYKRLSNSEEIIKSLGYSPVALCFKIFKGIYKAPNGLVPMPRFWERSKGGHSVAIMAHNKEKRLLKFPNSWGKEWGDNGIGYLPDKYVDKYLIEAWFSGLASREENHKVASREIGEFRYELKSYKFEKLNNKVLHVIDVYKNEKIIGWVHFCFDDFNPHIIVEDLFIISYYRKKGIGTQLLDLVEHGAVDLSAKKVIYYLHVQDLLSQENTDAIENFFKEETGYNISPYKRAFKGCVYKVVKEL